MNTVDTKSQVCSLLWSNEYKEIVSAHGFANNEVTIWKYPSMVKTAELLGHTERVLHTAISPDGSTIVRIKYIACFLNFQMPIGFILLLRFQLEQTKPYDYGNVLRLIPVKRRLNLKENQMEELF